MLRTSKTIVIVDGYSTARELIKELQRLNASCIHVRSVSKPPSRLAQSFDSDRYFADLGYLGKSDAAATVLQRYKPSAVIAGSEPGVEYAEQLAVVMGLPTNDPAKATARRNKEAMITQIASAGLHCAHQRRITCTEDAEGWAMLQGNWPIVIKPLESAGSDGVTICKSTDEIAPAVDRALNMTNLLGGKNTGLLAQTFLDGPQFFVNTVSVHGVHHITDAWAMRSREVQGYANAMEDWILVDPLDRTSIELFEYTLKAITALGIRNGAAVSEVKMTSNGPALIETGARLNGPTMEKAPYLAAGLKGTQATAFAEMLVKPDAFSRNWPGLVSYDRKRAIAKSFFIFKGPGQIADVNGMATIRRLESWHSQYRPLSKGEEVTQTIDTVGRGGVVYWVHDDLDQVLSDLKTFRDLDDANELYRVDY